MMMTTRKTALLVLFLLGTLHTVASLSPEGGNLKGTQRSRRLKKDEDDKKKKEPKKRDCDISKFRASPLTCSLDLPPPM